jgi:hypothetical protein
MNARLMLAAGATTVPRVYERKRVRVTTPDLHIRGDGLRASSLSGATTDGSRGSWGRTRAQMRRSQA